MFIGILKTRRAMVEFSADQKHIRIYIPVSGLRDINRYHKGIITILDRIEIEGCSPEFRENLTAVYELLSHMLPDKEFLNRASELSEASTPDYH